MNLTEQERWKKEFDIAKRFMEPKHRIWRRLLKAYRMDYDHMGLENVVHRSRFYPLTRQLLASISFRYPHIFAEVDKPQFTEHAEIIAETANAANVVMEVKPEIQQALFDAAYCYMGWLKYDYNPPGNNDIIAPYVTANTMQNDMVSTRRISPFNMFIDPLTPPHKIHEARWMMEEMLVPLEFVKKDERFKAHWHRIKPISHEEKDSFLTDMEGGEDSTTEQGLLNEAKANGQMVLLREVHDRIHGKRITFAYGIDEPIEDIDHPFLEMDPVTIPDPQTGQPLMTGEMIPTGSWLVEGGFPYHAIKYDMTDGLDGPYNLPMMGYVEDDQKIQVESATRKVDILKRFSRIILGNNGEKELNADVENAFKGADDGSVIWVNDVNNGFREMQMGNIPQDQYAIEREARDDEESVLQVGGTALAGGSMTATQSSLVASFGQLNREWLQEAVVQAYRTTAINTIRIMSDPRYTPDEFIVGISNGDQRYERTITADILKVPFRLFIEANSMRPLFEQLEREDTLALVNTLRGAPEVDQMELIKMVLRTFHVSNPDKLIGQGDKASATRKAQLENQFMAGRLQEPGVLPSDDHETEMAAHQAWQSDPAITQLIQQLTPSNPQAFQQFQQAMQGHMQGHAQAAQGGGGGGGGGGGKTIPSTDDINAHASSIESTVRGNAQRISQAVSTDTNQN
jgi:hypothetical protein